MYAPRVFFSMVGVLIIVAIASYVGTGSVLIALIQTVISAVLIQVGYFVCILYLVRREKLAAERGTASDAVSSRQREPAKREEILPDAARNMPAQDI